MRIEARDAERLVSLCIILVAIRHSENGVLRFHLSYIEMHFVKIKDETIFLEGGRRNPSSLQVGSISIGRVHGVEIAVGGIFDNPFSIDQGGSPSMATIVVGTFTPK